MFERILVPTDGSGPATVALEYAGRIAATADVTIHVLYVAADDGDPADDGEPLASGRERAADAGAAVVDETHTGEPREVILEYAAASDVDVIVMGTRGRRGVGRLLLGSVTEAVVRDADVPVLVVRDAAEVRRHYPFETIAVPTDGSPHADAAVDRAFAVAGDHDATVHVLSVVDVAPAAIDDRDDLRLDRLERHAREVVDEAAVRAEAAGIDVTTAVRQGSPDRTIRSYADTRNADLLVMGTHGRSGLDRLLLGSVTERVLRTATVPVLTVRAFEQSDS